MNKKTDPHEIERLAVLSLVLEPLPEKNGCTTRKHDLNENIRLQHLQSTGVNNGKYFYLLAERINEVEGQPKVYWDLALEALKNSPKNISSKKYINQGLIAILMELVLAGMLTKGDGIDVCNAVPNILKASSEEDVRYRTEYLKLSWSTSTNEHKKEFPHDRIDSKNLYDYWKQTKGVCESLEHTSCVMWADGFVRGFPILQKMYKIARDNISQGLLRALEVSFPYGIEELARRGLNDNAGFIADYSAGVAFLLLRDVKDGDIII